jgi:hypothetical protein
MSYTIIISEQQRAALETIVNQHPEMTGPDKPLEYWPGMLKQLPKDEDETPGCQHGFCL